MADIIEQLRKTSDRKFRIIFDSVCDGIFLSDAQTGLFTDVNEAGCQMFGFPRDELIGRTIGFLSTNVPPYTQQDALEILNDSKAGEVQPFEWHCKAKDGHLFWAEISLRAISSPDNSAIGLAVVREITDRKMAEIALRESEKRFRSLVETISDYVWEADNRNCFTYLSARIRDILGYQPSELIGRTAFEFMAPADAARALEEVAAIVTDRSTFSSLLTPALHKDGRKVFIEISGLPIFDELGAFKGYRGIGRDVTLRALMVREIEDRDAILHAVSRSVALLHTSHSLADGMAEALSLVGETMRVERVLVIENGKPPDPRKAVLLSYGWQAPDVPVSVDLSSFSRPLSNSTELMEWYEPLAENKPVIDTIDTMRGTVAALFGALQIKSILLIPINVDNRPWGALGIHACKAERVWSRAEIESLRILADVIGSSIMRERYVTELATANTIVNSSPTMLFRLGGKAGFPVTFVGGNLAWFEVEADRLLAAPTSYQTLIHPDDLPKITATLRELTTTGAPGGRIEYRSRKGDSDIWVEARFNPIRDADGTLTEVEGVITDVTERKRAEEQMLRTARNDALTGLANRRVFVDALHLAIARARRGEKRFAILYLDLDHFKDVNDTRGHPAGDVLLKATADRLRAGIRETDLVSRFGGDEFAVLQTDIGDPADAGTLATKLLSLVSQPLSIEGSNIQIRTSIGIAVFEPDAPDPEELLSHADMALYRAKAEGRGTFKFFTEAMDVEVHRRVALATDLREAIANRELFLLYQPQIDLASRRIIGVEALVRWRHPHLGLLPPPDFIQAAEKSGLIGALGQWVLRESCEQTRKWIDAGIAPRVTAVNVSSIQFKAPLELEQSIATTLDEAGVPAHFIEIELTETALMETSREHNDVLQRLRARGIKLAIDDFGTGYSSLSYLRHFPVDLIKIAQDFVADITTDPNDAVIVKAAIGLMHELNLEVIAEGVETAEQLALLQSWGCRAAQGYYFAKPLTAKEIAPLLRHGFIEPAG